MIKNPYYVAEITSSRCSIEFSVNEIPTYNHFEETNTTSTATIEWPINSCIIENGLQKFEIKVMPLKKDTSILEKAFVRVKIYKAEAIEEYVPQELISEEIKLTFTEKKGLPIFIHKSSFEAKLPFETNGWINSVDLNKEDKNNLYKEIILWNEKILNIYKTSNLNEYQKVFKERNIQLNTSLYLSETDNSSPFHPKDKDIISLPDNLYKLELFANGKLASVRMPYELPGFRYAPKVINEDALGFSLNIYFHRKKQGEPLTIIR